MIGGFPTGQFMRNGMTKNLLEKVVCKLIRDTEASGIVMITEAWMKKIKNNAISEVESAQKLGIANSPDKEECLLVAVESDDGLCVSFMNPIIRDASGNPTLGAVLEITDAEGRFAGFFNKASAPVNEFRAEKIPAGVN